MASKPSKAPDFPYIVVPVRGKGEETILIFEEATGHSELDDADVKAKELAREGKTATIFHAMKVYAQVTKVDAVWSR